MKKKIIALILVLSFVCSAFIIPSFANTDVTDKPTQKLYTVLDKVVNGLVGGIAGMIATPKWEKKSDYVTSEYFYPGDTNFDKKGNGNVWKLGYSNASLLTGKEIGGGDYYVGGSLSVGKKLATEQFDDQKVRVVALDAGNGINIFAVLDAYGLANSDVLKIREQFATYAKSRNLKVNSVNISVLHQHSCVDTFGMNGDIISALFLSSARTIAGQKLPSGQNDAYMTNLRKVVLKSMSEATENMVTGNLYFGTVNAAKYIRDKRYPQIIEENINRFRFDPTDESLPETWICNGAIHCVGNGAGGTELTGDYPYYMEKYINENYNANFMYIQGAELAISSEYKDVEMNESYAENTRGMRCFGETLAKLVNSIGTSDSPVTAKFDIAFKEVFLPIDNNILVLAAKGGLLVNNVYKQGIGKYYIQTEIGYAEIGDDIALAIIGGELAPEIAYGGVMTSDDENNWTGKEWNYNSFDETTGDKKLIVFGLTNDQVGYLLPSNEWHSIFTENEEIVSSGSKSGDVITEEWISLVESIQYKNNIPT